MEEQEQQHKIIPTLQLQHGENGHFALLEKGEKGVVLPTNPEREIYVDTKIFSTYNYLIFNILY